MATKAITFDVSLAKLDSFKNKMEKLKETFAEGGGTLTYNISEPKYKEVLLKNAKQHWFTSNTYPFPIDGKIPLEYVTVDLEWTLNNDRWEVVGIVERQEDGQVTVHTTSENTEMPKEFYNGEIRCDHCKQIRKRNQGIVVHDEDNDEYLMVGTSCLTAFTGLNVGPIVQLFKINEGPREEHVHYGTVDKFIYNTEELLFAEFSKICQGARSIVPQDLAIAVFSVHNSDPSEKGKRLVRDYFSDAHAEKAKILMEKAKVWIKALDPETAILYKEAPEYYTDEEHAKKYNYEDIHNVKVLADQKFIKRKDIDAFVDAAFMYLYNSPEACKEREEKRAKMEAIKKEREDLQKVYEEKYPIGSSLTIEVIKKDRYYSNSSNYFTVKHAPGLFPVRIITLKTNKDRDFIEGYYDNQVSILVEGIVSEIEVKDGYDKILSIDITMNNAILKNDDATAEKQRKAREAAEEAARIAKEAEEKAIEESKKYKKGDSIRETVKITKCNSEIKTFFNKYTRQWHKSEVYNAEAINTNGAKFKWEGKNIFAENAFYKISGNVEYISWQGKIELKYVRNLGEAEGFETVVPEAAPEKTTINIAKAELSEPFTSKNGYELCKASFEDVDGNKYYYVTTPTSLIAKNINNIKQLKGNLKEPNEKGVYGFEGKPEVIM